MGEMYKEIANDEVVHRWVIENLIDKIIEKENLIVIEKGPVQPLEHLNCFSKHSLKKLLNTHGFRPLNLKEIIMINIKSFRIDMTSLKSFLKDIKSYFFSTSIKFKLK